MPWNTLKKVLCPGPQRQKSLNYSLLEAPEISPPGKNWLRPGARNVQDILRKPRRRSTKPTCDGLMSNAMSDKLPACRCFRLWATWEAIDKPEACRTFSEEDIKMNRADEQAQRRNDGSPTRSEEHTSE